MAKQILVDSLVQEIMKEVSLRVREIIREEIEIETKRFRKKLIREVNTLLVEHRSAAPARRLPAKTVSHVSVQKHRPESMIDTGDASLNSIMQETEGDPSMTVGINLKPANPFQQVVQQLNEQRRKPTNGNGNGELWKPPPGEGYDFDPTSMDPAAIDWSHMVDAIEERDKKSKGPA